MLKTIVIAFLFISTNGDAQTNYHPATKNFIFNAASYEPALSLKGHKKLFQRNTGMLVGLQRGKYTSLELGGEAHWRKISLLSPHIIGATANLAYNPGQNILGYHAGVWMKRGRINLTYGADLNYFTDFQSRQSFGFGPSVGFRFFGLHLVNGFNLLTNKTDTKSGEAPLPVNTFYMSLRYFFPVKNEFTWDRQTMKKKKARQKARMKRKKERSKNNNDQKNENKNDWNIFKSKS